MRRIEIVQQFYCCSFFPSNETIFFYYYGVLKMPLYMPKRLCISYSELLDKMNYVDVGLISIENKTVRQREQTKVNTLFLGAEFAHVFRK